MKTFRLPLLSCEREVYEFFCFSDGKSAGDDHSADPDLLLRGLEAEQGFRMTCCESSSFDEFLYSRVKMDQSNEVCDGRTITTDFYGNRVLRKAEFIHHARIRPRSLHRIQVFPLEILYQCQQERLLIAAIADDDGDGLQAGFLRGAPSAFSGDQFVDAVTLTANYNRLKNSALFNGSR